MNKQKPEGLASALVDIGMTALGVRFRLDAANRRWPPRAAQDRQSQTASESIAAEAPASFRGIVLMHMSG
jgi:hypothetical protein